MRKIQKYCMPQLLSETEVYIALLCQLCSTHYTAVTKNCLKRTSVIKVVIMKILMISVTQKKTIMCNHQINAYYCQQ